MEPPIYMVCDVEFDPAEGGLVAFADDPGRPATDAGDLPDQPTDKDWICPEHLEAAREAATYISRPRAREHVLLLTRSYRKFPFPLDDPVDLPDARPCPPRSKVGANLAFKAAEPTLRNALGAHRRVGAGSESSRLDDGSVRSLGQRIHGPFDVINHGLSVSREGPDVLNERRVFERRELVALARFEASGSSPNDHAPLDRVVIWHADDRFRPWLDAVLAAAAEPPVDLYVREPDLVDVDLGDGRLGAMEFFGTQWIEWDLPGIDFSTVFAEVRALIPDLAALRGLQAPAEYRSASKRTYGSTGWRDEPPYRSSTSEGRLEATSPDAEVSLRTDISRWNDDDVNSSALHLDIGPLGVPSRQQRDRRVGLGAWTGSGKGRAVHTVRLDRPTSAQIVELVRLLVDTLRLEPSLDPDT